MDFDGPRFAAVLALLLALSHESAWAEPKQTAMQSSKGTLQGKLIVGYQGWFGCPDSSHHPQGKWVHWMKDGEATIDMLPDPTELTPAERCATQWTNRAGQTVDVPYGAESDDSRSALRVDAGVRNRQRRPAAVRDRARTT